MITLYDNPFSPFTRKLRLVLAHKRLAYARVDGLALDQLPALKALNPRGEVPALVDDGITVVNSADIVDYLEHRYPERPVRPADPAARVKARAWERLCDTVFDAIFHDISLWRWPTHQRKDHPPAGLMEAASRDLARILGRMEADLAGRDFVCGDYSIADMALWPHVSALRPLGLFPEQQQFPAVVAWIRRMRGNPDVQADIANARQAVEQIAAGKSPYEGHKVIWRGDRIEWLFSHGFHDWLLDEIRAGRAVIPTSL